MKISFPSRRKASLCLVILSTALVAALGIKKTSIVSTMQMIHSGADADMEFSWDPEYPGKLRVFRLYDLDTEVAEIPLRTAATKDKPSGVTYVLRDGGPATDIDNIFVDKNGTVLKNGAEPRKNNSAILSMVRKDGFLRSQMSIPVTKFPRSIPPNGCKKTSPQGTFWITEGPKGIFLYQKKDAKEVFKFDRDAQVKFCPGFDRLIAYQKGGVILFKSFSS